VKFHFKVRFRPGVLIFIGMSEKLRLIFHPLGQIKKLCLIFVFAKFALPHFKVLFSKLSKLKLAIRVDKPYFKGKKISRHQ
jgi:hypothetical protein